MKIADGLYSYEWTNYYENNCNSFFIGGGVGALIDPGLKSFVPDLLRRMAADGIDGKDIRYVINTHSHPDHFDGSEYFHGREIRIGLHEDEVSFLAGVGGELYGLFGLPRPSVTVDLALSEGTAEFGGEEFQIFHVPGHSPGSIALYWPKTKALFSGDVIFNQNVGRTDFPGGSGALLKKSIRSLSTLEVELLLPGHMEIIAGTEKVQGNFQTVIRHIFPYI